MIYVKFRRTFDSENDSFRLEFLLVPVTGLSFLENHSFTPLEVKKTWDRKRGGEAAAWHQAAEWAACWKAEIFNSESRQERQGCQALKPVPSIEQLGAVCSQPQHSRLIFPNSSSTVHPTHTPVLCQIKSFGSYRVLTRTKSPHCPRFASHRYYGPSPSTWSPWLSFLSSSWSARRGKQRPSRHTTFSSWASTALSTLPTGSGATTRRISTTRLL